jgi:large subunit ribosomal protein L4
VDTLWCAEPRPLRFAARDIILQVEWARVGKRNREFWVPASQMAIIDIKDLEGVKIREHEVPDELFMIRPNQGLLWEAVKSYLANRRQGTHSTKSRGEVRGGGKKPWRQKGTGRARAGSIRSSLWRHGSIAHGPKPRDYAVKLPAKMERAALRAALAAKFQDNKLTVVEQLELQDAKTKVFSGALRKLGIERSVLVVNDSADRNLQLSSRNIEGCDLIRHHELGAYDVLSHDGILLTESVLTRLERALA